MPFTQGHALLIGVGSHQYHPNLNVPVTVEDAKAIGAVLQDPNACAYPAAQVNFIHDEQTTKQGILQALDDLCQFPKTDTVFLFYCGHGALGLDGKYYLVSHDARLTGARVVEGTGVREDELLEKLRAFQAERVFLIFNACFSGNISPSLDVERSEYPAQTLPEDSSAAILGTGTGRIIITACKQDEKSYLGKGNLTIFTQAMVDGLRGNGVRNSGGFISAFGLYESVYETVTDKVQNDLKKSQTPELTVIKGAGPFAVALYKGASSLGTFDENEALPADTATREVKQDKAERRLNQIITTNQSGGVNIGGGARVTVRGDIVGRDKVTYGDEVRGDKITTGNITGSAGVAIGRGATSNVTQGIGGQDLNALFQQVYRQIDARKPDPNVDKDEIKDKVQKVQAEAGKGDQANPAKVERWLQELKEIAPDIVQVTAAALLNPVAGVAAALRAIAARIR